MGTENSIDSETVYKILNPHNDIKTVLEIFKDDKNSEIHIQKLIDILEKVVKTLTKKNMNAIHNLLNQLYYIKSQKVYGSGINDEHTFKMYKKYGRKAHFHASQI